MHPAIDRHEAARPFHSLPVPNSPTFLSILRKVCSYYHQLRSAAARAACWKKIQWSVQKWLNWRSTVSISYSPLCWVRRNVSLKCVIQTCTKSTTCTNQCANTSYLHVITQRAIRIPCQLGCTFTSRQHPRETLRPVQSCNGCGWLRITTVFNANRKVVPNNLVCGKKFIKNGETNAFLW